MKHRAPRRGVRRFVRLPRIRFLPGLPRFVRWPLMILGTALFVGAVGTTVVAYAFDRADSDRILPGIKVAGVDLSGMRRYKAVRAVRAELDPPLRRPLTIHVGGRSVRVIPAELGVHPRVYPAVDRALAMSQSMTWVPRSYHRLFGWKVHASFPVKYAYPSGKVPPIIARLAHAIDTQPRSAELTTSANDMSIVSVHSKTGRSVDQKKALALVMHALRTRATSVRIPIRVVQPEVSDRTLGKTITVDLSTNTLHLYGGFHVERTYPVATAIFPYSTPIGTWHVVQKEDMPTWINPGTPWAASMPPSIPPGPDNPLGLRALALDAPGVLIHGTPEDSSVGHYASHGCIRMHESDAIALYPLVPAGTKVIIFGAPPWGASRVAGQVAGF